MQRTTIIVLIALSLVVLGATTALAAEDPCVYLLGMRQCM